MFQQPAIVQIRSFINPERKIQVYYPVVTGLKDTKVQQEINRTIIENLNQLLKGRDFYEPSLVELQGNMGSVLPFT